MTYDAQNTLGDLAIATGRPVLVGDASEDQGYTIHLSQVASIGPVDETISQIRTSIFQLRGPLVPGTNSAHAELLTVADEVSELLGFTPQLRFNGPIDTVVSASVLDELTPSAVAVWRICNHVPRSVVVRSH
jgi:hypothetical protein